MTKPDITMRVCDLSLGSMNLQEEKQSHLRKHRMLVSNIYSSEVGNEFHLLLASPFHVFCFLYYEIFSYHVCFLWVTSVPLVLGGMCALT